MTPKTPLIFAPGTSAAFAAQVTACLGTTLAATEEREFEHGEHKMRPACDVRGRDVYVVHSMHGDQDHSANDKLCRLLFFIGALKDAGAEHVTACVPYLAYARKDRRTRPRDPITTRYVASMFEAVGTDRVVVLDVHNEAALDNAFRIETLRIEAAATFAAALTIDSSRPLVVASPDAGGMKRAHQFRRLLEARYSGKVGTAFMEKARADGVVSGETFVGDVRDAEVIIYDDMIASGTTILRAVAAARKAGAAKVHAAATHAVFTDHARALFAATGPDSVLVSDSVCLDAQFATGFEARLRVCTVAPLFAEIIRRLATGLPTDDLTRTG
jgi:ribose-phosphate pyrophosphokinase